LKFQNPYWGNQTKIELLQKWLIIHSIIYYELNTSVVSDAMYDQNSNQLIELIKADRQSFRSSRWYRIFKDFDGSTGFDLYSKLSSKEQNELEHLAMQIVKLKEVRDG